MLQRFASSKTQDASEMKVMMENLVMDLLTTLNLPEYPASAPILEVPFLSIIIFVIFRKCIRLFLC